MMHLIRAFMALRFCGCSGVCHPDRFVASVGLIAQAKAKVENEMRRKSDLKNLTDEELHERKLGIIARIQKISIRESTGLLLQMEAEA